jgi:putative DNA primase/helicase
MLTNALKYASLGWKVFPLRHIRNGVCSCYKGNECGNPGKHPEYDKDLLPNGLKNASNDLNLIRQWWEKWPNANIGVSTGPTSGIVVLDIDVKNGGYEWLKEMAAKHGGIPHTVEATTGSGGKHFYFKYPGWFVKSTNNQIDDGVDIRGDGGLVVIPPSANAKGPYIWVNDPFQTELADIPEWLAAEIRKTNGTKPKTERKGGRVWRKLLEGPKVYEGGDTKNGVPGRDQFLFELGAWMRSKGAGFEDILETLLAVNEARCVPPLDESDVYQKAKSASKYKIGGNEGKKSLLDYENSDVGNAERLIHRHGIDLRYCIELECWLIWDGVKWAKDESFEIYRRAVDTMRAYRNELHNKWKEAIANDDEETANKLKFQLAYSLKYLSKGKINSIIELARTLPGVPISVNELDQNPYLINHLNGTFDLKKGIFRQHDRNDLITLTTNIHYDPNAKAERWHQFISEIMKDDKDKMRFLQMYAGYCASGDTSESKFPISHGNGANGKSVFNNLLLYVLGDYAMQASSSLIMAKNVETGAPNPEVVQIRGKRLVIVSETTDGMYLDEQFVKAATGNDPIRARDLYAKPFSFRPTCKFLLATNHKPLIRGTDNGIWRRIVLVPFEEQFDEEQQDKRLEDKLIAEASGIFNWIVKGFELWQKEGLQMPDSMKKATTDYREVMDSIGNFIKERCVIQPNATIKLKPLYEAYKEWCEEVGERASNSRMFKKRMEERGFKQGRDASSRFWVGISIATHYEHPATSVNVEPNNVIDMPKKKIDISKDEKVYTF